MLSIPIRLPVKRMAMYGSTAMLVGFTGTLAMLRQFAPKDSPTGISVVETINRKPSSSTASELDAKKAGGQSAASVTALPDQGSLVVRSSKLPAQQYSPLSTATPTYTAPTASNAPAAPITSAPVATAGGSAPQQTTTQPSTQQPTSGGSTTTQSNLQETITSTTNIDLNTVRLP